MRFSGTSRLWHACLLAGAALILGSGVEEASAKKWCKDECEVELEEAKIYFEYNASANDLGVHVLLDGEDWKKIKIENPCGKTIFKVEGKQGYAELGMTELFFEGAEPNLEDFPLDDLLDLFPEGDYEFEGKTVDGCEVEGSAYLSHAIPEGPDVSASLNGNELIIEWTTVDDHPDGFPDREIDIVAYQVIVEPSFQVTLPGTATKVTVSPEFVASLPTGENKYEVLAIDASGNQTITEGTFEKP
jgi:hypothetical protein